MNPEEIKIFLKVQTCLQDLINFCKDRKLEESEMLSVDDSMYLQYLYVDAEDTLKEARTYDKNLNEYVQKIRENLK